MVLEKLNSSWKGKAIWGGNGWILNFCVCLKVCTLKKECHFHNFN